MTGLSRQFQYLAAAMIGAVALALWTVDARAQARQTTERPAEVDVASDASKKKESAKDPLTVAVLDFAAETPDGAALGKQIAEILSTSLGTVDGLKVVDRTVLAEAFKEQELNLTGLVNPQQAVQVGRLVGAKLLVTGKAFALDDQLFITAKIVGTETSLVEGVLVKGEKGDTLAKLMPQLVEKLTVRLREKGPDLVAAADAPAVDDPVLALTEKLKKVRKPVIAVRVTERHLAGHPPAARDAGGADPAVETELRKALVSAGFKVIDGGEREQAEGGVEVVVSGEAFSELAARIGNLVSCSARAELKLTERKTGAALYADRATTRSADLSENIAGKAALQQAGHTLAVRLLQHFADTLKPVEGQEAPAPEKK